MNKKEKKKKSITPSQIFPHSLSSPLINPNPRYKGENLIEKKKLTAKTSIGEKDEKQESHLIIEES